MQSQWSGVLRWIHDDSGLVTWALQRLVGTTSLISVLHGIYERGSLCFSDVKSVVLLLADVCDDPQVEENICGSKLSSSNYYHSIYIYDQHLKEF